RDALALVVNAARAHGDDGALLGLLLGGVRDHKARRGGGFGLKRLDDDAVLERLESDHGGGRHDLTSPSIGPRPANAGRPAHVGRRGDPGPACRRGCQTDLCRCSWHSQWESASHGDYSVPGTPSTRTRTHRERTPPWSPGDNVPLME